jgi:aryl carrier-like protein
VPTFGGVGSTQGQIAEIWRAVLDAPTAPGADVNFFDAGGDSLLLLTVHDRMQRNLNVTLTVTDLFAHSTIRKQSALVDRLRAD